MAVIAMMLLIGGIILVVLSQWRQGAVFGVPLPQAAVRRVWLPSGLLLITLSVLFIITYSTTLPSSPLRMAETDAANTRAVNSTMWVHTQYFQIHTSTHEFETMQARMSTLSGTVTANPITQFQATATSLIRDATATQIMLHQETLAAGDFIAQTGTANVNITPTPRP